MLAVAVILVAGSSGCAAVIKGRKAPVTFTSDPPGAEVYVDGELVGVTPLTAQVPQGNHGVVAKKAGFGDAGGQITSSFSGHTLWIGPTSLLLDAILGTVRTIDTNMLMLRLVPSGPGPDVWAKAPGGAAAPVATAPPPPAEEPEKPVEPRVPHDVRHFAFVVGISSYQNDLPPSSGSDNDARAFARFAEEFLGVPRRNIVLAVGQQATKSFLEAQIDEWLPRNLDAKSTLYVYFAGHGAPDPTTGDAYLVPWEADPRYIKSQGLKLRPLLDRVEKLPGTRKVVFLDSCFSGSGGRSVIAKGTRPLVPVDKDFAGAAHAGMVVFAAAGANQTTGTTRDGKRGLFSHYVMRGLEGNADRNKDGKVTVEELSAFVTDKVADEAARDNREQRPVVLAGSEDVKRMRVR